MFILDLRGQGREARLSKQGQGFGVRGQGWGSGGGGGFPGKEDAPGAQRAVRRESPPQDHHRALGIVLL